MRFLFRFEIEHLVARSRLELAALHGDFAGGALATDSREYVVAVERGERDDPVRRGHPGVPARVVV
jgi:hypothetical protein